MTTGSEWEGRVGHSWAAEWRRTDRSFAGLTRVLLERIAAMPARRIVDVGCGAGEVSLALAAARPDARVTGIDLSEELLAAARARAGTAFANLAFEHADASAWRSEAAPELYVSRHGVMFFPDPPAAFGHLAAAAAPGARLAFSCFAPPADNPWAGEVARAVAGPGAGLAPSDPTAPGPFAFADPARVEAILSAGGWSGIGFEQVGYDYVAGAGEDPVADALSFARRIGPAARALRELPPPEGEAAEARLRELFAKRLAEGRVGWPGSAWIVTARKG